MFKTTFSLLTVLLLSFSNLALAKTFTSQLNGNWHDPATWGETVDLPSISDTVIIDGHDIYLFDNFVTIASLQITNLNGSTVNAAQLDITGAIKLTVTGDVFMTAENVDQDVKLVQISTSVVEVGGNFTMTRVATNVQSKGLQLDLSGNSELKVTGVFYYEYAGGAEIQNEVTLADNALFRVDGNTHLLHSAGSGLQLSAANTATIDFNGNLSILTTGGTGASVYLYNDVRLDIAANLTISNSNSIFSRLTASSGAEVTIGGDVAVTSVTAGNLAALTANGSNSRIKIDGDFTLNAIDDNNAYLSLAGGSALYLGGTINRPSNYGSFITTSLDTITFNGDVAQSIPAYKLAGAGNDSLEFNNVVFNNSVGITLSGDMIIDTDLELTEGIITTSDAALLILTDNVVISGGSKTAYIDGPIIKRGRTNGAAFSFPVGNNGQYAPIGISAVTEETAEYKAKYTGCPPPVGFMVNAPIQSILTSGYWELRRLDGASVGDVELIWTDANQAGVSDISSTVVAYLSDPLLGWFSLGRGSSTGGTGLGVAGSISNDIGCPPPVDVIYFTFGSTDNSATLPLEFIKFNAQWQPEMQQVALNWQTESEINTDYFIIEKSIDGINYEAIGTRDAAVNSNSVQYYYSKDPNPGKGNNYYRIMSVDQEGMMSFSRMINIFVKAFEQVPVAYPNPMEDYVRIYSKSLQNEEVIVRVFDMTGRQIYQETHTASQGHLYLLSANMKLEKGGNYLLSYDLGGLTYSMIITKQP